MPEQTSRAEETTSVPEPTPITLDFTHVGTLAEGVSQYLVREQRGQDPSERLFWRKDTPAWISGSGDNSLMKNNSLMNYVADNTEPGRGDFEVFYGNVQYGLSTIVDGLYGMDKDEVDDFEVTDLYESVEADPYTHDLLKWLAADSSHLSLCEERGKEFGWTLDSEQGLVGLLMMGQAYQREGFVSALFEYLKEKCEENEE